MILKLFLIFLKIGFFAYGGGWGVLSIIRDEIVRVHGVLSMTDFLNMISIAQLTPGPIAVNVATYTGFKLAGFFGALSSTIGVILPGVLLSIIAYTFLLYIEKKYSLDKLYRSLRVGVIVLVTYTTYLIFTSSAIIDYLSVIVFISLLIIYFIYRKLNPLYIVLFGGIFYLILKVI